MARKRVQGHKVFSSTQVNKEIHVHEKKQKVKSFKEYLQDVET